MKRLFVGVICAVVGASAMADEWRLASISDDVAVLYNVTSMQTEGKYTSTWIVHSYRQKNEFNHDYALTWGMFDCKKPRYRDVTTYYGALHKTPERTPADTTWRVPIPGSNLSNLLKAMCAGPNNDTVEKRNATDVTIAIRKDAKAVGIW